MKKLNILFLSLILTFNIIISEQEDEQRYLEKEGKIYKINSSSLHLTPSKEDQNIIKSIEEIDSPSKLIEPKEEKELSTESKCSFDLTVKMGTLSPIGSGSDYFDPGTTLSLIFPTNLNFNLLGREFDIAAEINLSNLEKISNSDDDNNIKSLIAHFKTDLELPVKVSFGLGLADINQYNNSGKIQGTGLIDVIYELPFDNNALSIGIRYQKYVDLLKESPFLDFNLLDTYSLNLNYSKTLSF